jgi:hypothetical protein
VLVLAHRVPVWAATGPLESYRHPAALLVCASATSLSCRSVVTGLPAPGLQVNGVATCRAKDR